MTLLKEVAMKARRNAKPKKKWKRPTIVEIPVGLEINAYAGATTE